MENKENWLALAAGNSRLHWGWFKHYTLVDTWDTPHISNTIQLSQLPQLFFSANLINQIIKQSLLDVPIYLASVVSHQTELWQDYAQLNLISLQDIKLTNLYPTIGIDRALATWGAIATYHQACLVIDGGTALTFTGVNEQGKLIGGAILPGLRSQLLTLKQKTAALPEIELPNHLPLRWALDTDTAIASGILYTAISGIHDYILDWLGQFPSSQVIFTGGDGELLLRSLHQQFPELATKALVDSQLIFEGIKLVYAHKNLL